MSGDWVGDLVLGYWLLVIGLNLHERIIKRRKRATGHLSLPIISTKSAD